MLLTMKLGLITSQRGNQAKQACQRSVATYCPFSRGLEPINNTANFEEAYADLMIVKIREIEGRHRLLMKENIEPTKVVVLEY